MPNFYTENDDIRFHFKNLDLNRIIELREDDFKEKNQFDYAPKDIEDAKDSYHRILEVVGDLSGNFIEPRAAEVDQEGAHFENGEVTYAKGTQESLDVCNQAELIGFTLPRKYGGLNCPMTLYTMAIEMISRADASFMNIFGLQADIANTIYKFADDEEIKRKYIPPLCSGEYTSSMILTEPDAGSDLQAVMLKAEQDEDGNWFLNGVKRFITNGCGEIGLVLARSEKGSKDGRGLSMFLYKRDETMVIRRIEDKMGIHGSPTCELQFNHAPAILIGKRKMGLIRYVMSLMNEARVGIAAQALGIAEAAYQEALKYAKERVQFHQPIKELIPVSELLVSMKTKVEGARALLYETTRIVDLKDGLEEMIEKYPEKKKELRSELKKFSNFAGLLTPICKAYNAEISNQVSYDGIQVHGGTGFMKDFNAERHYRDARITSIYEGTTQLQVVAAIGGIMKGTIFQWVEEFEAGHNFNTVSYFHNILKKMCEELKTAVKNVEEKHSTDYQNYHSRRLVEMGTSIVIGYLFLRDSTLSERKKDVLKYFLDFAAPDNRMKAEIINSNTDTLLEKKNAILDSLN